MNVILYRRTYRLGPGAAAVHKGRPTAFTD